MWKTEENKIITLAGIEAIEGQEIIVFDFETTGLGKTKKPIQCSAIKYRVKNGELSEEIDTFDTYIYPGCEVSPKITEITGITNDMLKDAPNLDEAFEKMYEFFGDNPNLAGYNSKRFDLPLLEELYEQYGKILCAPIHMDVYNMAQDIISKEECKKHNLSVIAEYCGLVEDDEGFHSSLYDSRITGKLLNIFLNAYRNNEDITCQAPKKELTVANFTSANYWDKFQNGYPRIYVNTDMGSLYYDVRRKCWNSKDAPIEKIDMERLRSEVLTYFNANNEDEMVKIAKAR